MPQLQFDGNEGYKWLELITRMTYPNDDNSQRELFAHEVLYHNLSQKGEDDLVTMSAPMARNLLMAPGLGAIQEHMHKHNIKAQIAGYILYTMAKLNHHRPEDASLNKAFQITEHYLTHHTEAKQHKVGGSQTKIWEYWNSYKSVSHFWAAWHLLRWNDDLASHLKSEYPDTLSHHMQHDFLPGNDAELAIFLPLADVFLDFGTAFIPLHSKSGTPPMLDTKLLWTAPPIPKGSVTVQFSPLRDWETDIITTYSAKAQ